MEKGLDYSIIYTQRAASVIMMSSIAFEMYFCSHNSDLIPNGDPCNMDFAKHFHVALTRIRQSFFLSSFHLPALKH